MNGSAAKTRRFLRRNDSGRVLERARSNKKICNITSSTLGGGYEKIVYSLIAASSLFLIPAQSYAVGLGSSHHSGVDGGQHRSGGLDHHSGFGLD
ncbi:hypothetical protein [Brucella vulpis]|uniref:hypothetical protein n=1 Tax=Brucella vulpis TaxID=981386 RepID=UPI0040397D2D